MYTLYRWGIFCAACLIAGPIQALQWQGDKTQGALLIGRVAPGTQVQYADFKIPVSPEGVFLIGFGREAELKQNIKLTKPDGGTETHSIELTARKYDVQNVDGLPKDKVSPTEKEWQRIAEETALVVATRNEAAPRTDFLNGFIWPLDGIISGVYGSQRILNKVPKRPHFGLDIAAPKGTPVKAPAAGVITLTHPDMFYTGATVVLDHGYGLTSLFVHLSRIDVNPGDRLEQGQVIGAVGATGRATGPHLHWGMFWFKTAVDPLLLLPPRESSAKPAAKKSN
jgi:murein DD-endopeptidase MepM/ murein hydrolase activator NlpD